MVVIGVAAAFAIAISVDGVLAMVRHHKAQQPAVPGAQRVSA
ncbi:MAG: hypothetical protein P9M14_09065 [Candidatus Alcyoniella australis]|nr:hypothetical protein [Candidatus Alcyoniella australis]